MRVVCKIGMTWKQICCWNATRVKALETLIVHAPDSHTGICHMLKPAAQQISEKW